MTVLTDFSRLPDPKVIQDLDYETLLASAKAEFVKRMAAAGLTWDADLESDPVNVLLETIAYLELVVRQRINDAAQALLLAYASGSDLDALGANVGILRLDGETDSRFRSRIQQGFFLASAAGPAGAYRLHAMSVSTQVLEVHVWSPAPGQVQVVVLAQQPEPDDATDTEKSQAAAIWGANAGHIIARNDSDIIQAVRAALNAEDVRPLTDQVVVRAPELIAVTISATLTLYEGPDAALLLTESLDALDSYLATVRKPAYDVSRAGIIDALYVAGCHSVQLDEPAADVTISDSQMAIPVIAVTVAEGRKQ